MHYIPLKFIVIKHILITINFPNLIFQHYQYFQLQYLEFENFKA